MTPGLRFGRYEVGERIGKGGFGVVHQGRDTELGRDVAIKFLRPEYLTRESIVQRFLQEARAAAKIGHPGIVTVFECGTVQNTGQRLDGTAYIVMELLQGTSLSNRTGKPFPVSSVIAIGRQLASALQAAHTAGIVHRDLKPDNVFLVPDAAVVGGERAKILDFGIAKLADPGPGGVHTHSQMMLGTPRYMAPEQARSAAKADARSDIYSLGCILFELVCGRTPFDGRDAGDIIIAHQSETLPSPSELVDGVPGLLERLIVEMLAKNPDERLASMRLVDEAFAVIAMPQHAPEIAPIPKAIVAPPRPADSSVIEPPPGPPPEPRADGDELSIPRPRVGAREVAGMIARGTIAGSHGPGAGESSTLAESTLHTKRGMSRATLGMIGGSVLVLAIILFVVCNRSSSPATIDASITAPVDPVDAPLVRDAPADTLDGEGQALRDLRALEAALAARDIKTATRLLAEIPSTSRYAQRALEAYNRGVENVRAEVVAELDALATVGDCAQLSIRVQALEERYGHDFAEDARARIKPCGNDRSPSKPEGSNRVPKPPKPTSDPSSTSSKDDPDLDACPDAQEANEISKRGDELLQRGQFTAALAKFDRLARCFPRFASKAYLTACRAKNFTVARRHFRQLGSPDNLAQICMKEGYDPRSADPPF